MTASAGISLYPEDGEEVEALLKSADTAMYRAKERGRDNFQLFSAAMTEKALERRSLEDEHAQGARQAGADAPLPALPRSSPPVA